MVMDGPVIDYNTKPERKKGSMMASKREVDELDALQAAWEAKRKGKSFVGETFSLDGFLKKEM